MNNFKETLKVNNRRNIDEVIYRKIFSEVKKLSQKLTQNSDTKDKKTLEQVGQIQERLEYLTDAFINFENTKERINEYDRKYSIDSNPTQIDEYIQKVIEKVEIETCNKFDGDKERQQVKERAQTLKNIFQNFELYAQKTKEAKNQARTDFQKQEVLQVL